MRCIHSTNASRTDSNSTIDIYSGSALHDGQHLILRQHSLVYRLDPIFKDSLLAVNKPYSGIPFNDTTNFRLAIAERGQAILGDYLIGIQAGNEPDLYARHGHRPSVSLLNYPSSSVDEMNLFKDI